MGVVKQSSASLGKSEGGGGPVGGQVFTINIEATKPGRGT